MTEQGQLSDVDESTDAPDEPTEKLKEIAEDTDTDLADVRDRYETQCEYGVPEEEALRTVSRALGATTANVQGGSDEATRVADLERDTWATVEAYVVGDDFGEAPGAVSQKAHLADESGLIAAVAFESSDLDKLEVGASYRLSDLRVEKDEYTAEEHGIKRLVAKLNSSTGVKEIEDVGTLGPHEPAEPTEDGDE
jgi:replication factor A1